MLKGFKEASVSGAGSLCREEAPVPPRRGPVPPRGGPCAAERRPLCREETLCAGRYSVLRGLEEALCRDEAPVPRGGPCAAEGRPLCREEALCAAERKLLCR